MEVAAATELRTMLRKPHKPCILPPSSPSPLLAEAHFHPCSSPVLVLTLHRCTRCQSVGRHKGTGEPQQDANLSYRYHGPYGLNIIQYEPYPCSVAFQWQSVQSICPLCLSYLAATLDKLSCQGKHPQDHIRPCIVTGKDEVEGEAGHGRSQRGWDEGLSG